MQRNTQKPSQASPEPGQFPCDRLILAEADEDIEGRAALPEGPHPLGYDPE